MMQIEQNTIDKLEKLSMINIGDDKKEDMKKSLEEIIGFMDNLSSIDTEHIKENMYFHSKETPLRDDEVKKSSEFKDVLANAPHSEENMFIVPKIIE